MIRWLTGPLRSAELTSRSIGCPYLATPAWISMRAELGAPAEGTPSSKRLNAHTIALGPANLLPNLLRLTPRIDGNDPSPGGF